MRYLVLGLFVAATLTGCPTPGDDDDDNGPVSLVINDDTGAPVAGAEFLVHDTNGTYVDTILSDDEGTAQLDLPNGGMTTHIGLLGGSFPLIETYMGLENNGLTLDFSPFSGGDLVVTLPADVPGAQFYAVDIGCYLEFGSVASLDVSVQVRSDCGEVVDILATALDDTFTAMAATVALGVDAQAGTVTMDPWQTVFDDSLSVTVTAPPGAASIFGSVQLWRNGLPFYAGDADLSSGSVSLPFLSGFADRLEFAAYVEFPDGGTASYTVSDGTVPSTMSVDLLNLTGLSGYAFDDTDPSRPTLSHGSGVFGDWGSALLIWTDSAVGGTFISINRTPPFESLRLPDLGPNETQNQRTGSSVQSQESLNVIDYDFVDTYRDALSLHFSQYPSSYVITGKGFRRTGPASLQRPQQVQLRRLNVY